MPHRFYRIFPHRYDIHRICLLHRRFPQMAYGDHVCLPLERMACFVLLPSSRIPTILSHTIQDSCHNLKRIPSYLMHNPKQISQLGQHAKAFQ